MSDFDLGRFLSATGKSLAEYSHAFLSAKEPLRGDADFTLLSEKLESMDVEHTVYALELCAIASPQKAIPLLIEFFAHTDAAVCCSAFRAFFALPSAHLDGVGKELFARIENVPIVALRADIYSTQTPITVGTNAGFLTDLKSRIARK